MRDPFRHPQPLDLPADFRIAIIGSGFAGLGMAIALRKAGFDNFIVLEKGAGIGGTWYANSYPGAACDVKSHLYSYSFELNPRWSRKFAPQPEILAYMNHCVEKYDLARSVRLGCEISRADFDEQRGVWTLTTTSGEQLEANAVVSACGGLSRPSYADIPGTETFRGALFHTARWNDSEPLDGKAVAVVGTGASAIQVVPELAPKVRKLTLYQRTPPWIIARDDTPISARAQQLFARYPALQRLVRAAIYWRLEGRVVALTKAPLLMSAYQWLVEGFLKRSIADDALRTKVTPNYTVGCKRILLSNDYYPALQRKNVELVCEGVATIEPDGIRSAGGEVRKHDCIVMATGFQTKDDIAPFPIYGRGQNNLSEQWAHGAEAFKGTTVSGYPNLFMLVGPNTGLGHSSMIFMIEAQIRYVMSALSLIARRSLRHIEVRQDAQDHYNARLHQRLAGTVWATGCNSWYRSSNGKNTALWPGFTWYFRYITREIEPAYYRLTS